MNRNRFKVTVCGMDLTLFADNNEEYVKNVAREVERQMEEMMRGNNRVSLITAAVMTAMSCCDDELQAEGQVDRLRTQVKQYVADSARMQQESERSRTEIAQLKAVQRTMQEQAETMQQTAGEQAAQLNDAQTRLRESADRLAQLEDKSAGLAARLRDAHARLEQQATELNE